LLKSYPSFTRYYVERELPMDEGWAFYNWAVENDGFLRFAGIDRDGDGYIAQAAKRFLKDGW
jgi:hypothetical protein